jgi:hypothetical protein
VVADLGRPAARCGPAGATADHHGEFDSPGSGELCVAGVSTESIASMNATVLWIIAAILVVVGIVQLIQGQIILGIVLIVVGCLVGPGGYSIFRSRA